MVLCSRFACIFAGLYNSLHSCWSSSHCLVKRVSAKSDFVDFRDYCGQISIFFRGVISNSVYDLPKRVPGMPPTQRMKVPHTLSTRIGSYRQWCPQKLDMRSNLRRTRLEMRSPKVSCIGNGALVTRAIFFFPFDDSLAQEHC